MDQKTLCCLMVISFKLFCLFSVISGNKKGTLQFLGSNF